MQQVIPHPIAQPTLADMPDLARYGLFIHLGSVREPGRLDLALQALGKTLRCWEGSVRLLVAAEERIRPHRPMPPHCGFHLPGELRGALRRNGATVLAPAFSDPQGDIILHAIASGVPLGALNLAPIRGEVGIAYPLDGHAFLGVTHVQIAH